MTMEISVDIVLGLFDRIFERFCISDEDDTDLYFVSHEDFVELFDTVTEQITNLRDFDNIMGGNLIADKTGSVMQLTLFVASEEGISCLTKLFSINY